MSCLFPLQSSVILLTAGMAVYMLLGPYAEAAEQTIPQKVVPYERQGRVFGFAQSIEQAASPLTAFLIGPITQLVFIPFMTTGAGVDLIGSWFGTGPDRGIALVFVLTGLLGLVVTLLALRSRPYRQLSERYTGSRSWLRPRLNDLPGSARTQALIKEPSAVIASASSSSNQTPPAPR